MTSNIRLFSLVVSLPLALAATACDDASQQTLSPTAPVESSSRSSSLIGPASEKYVAIGTSISMGWASNGVYDESQRTSWPALLAFATDGGMSLPLIQSPGCTSPIVGPLGGGLRLSGESISGSSVCAPNDAGVTLPTQNVGLAAALAADAVATTPEASSNPWFARVLPPGMTELTAALSQNPTIVSVELGGNEVLNATSGLVAPGVTVVPLSFFTAPYDALLDALKPSGTKAVLVGLPVEARSLPALRRGDEIWADRAEFAALHVTVSDDCNGNLNYINVSVKSLNMVFTGAFTSSHGLPNPVFSCADVPGTQDLVLTPSDITTINGMLAAMNDHIKAQAAARGYAFFSLGVMYDSPQLKSGRYSVVNQLTSRIPYGVFISLDGVHPTALGNIELAAAAAGAIVAKYHIGAHVRSVTTASSLADQVGDEMLPSAALAQALSIAAAHQNDRIVPCAQTNGCEIRGLRAMK